MSEVSNTPTEPDDRAAAKVMSERSFLPLVTFTSPEGHEYVTREVFDELAGKAQEYRAALNWIHGFAGQLADRHTGFVHICRRAQAGFWNEEWIEGE